MLLYWCSWEYLGTMAVLGVALAFLLVKLLRWRRKHRQHPTPAGRRLIAPLFGVWVLLSLLFTLELGFAAFMDTTDAFKATNVSARWFERHIEPYRNRDGFRDRRQFSPDARDGVSKIAMVGDSFTIGQGIERMEDRFSDMSEVIINKRRSAGDSTVQVYNLGEFGWEVSLIEGMVKGLFRSGYELDVVVYIYMLNDIEGYDPRTEEVIKTVQQSQPTSWLITDTYFFNWMHFLWRQNQAKRTVDYFPHLSDSYREAPWEGVQRKLLSMHNVCQENGSELRMVFFPFLHNLGPDYEFQHAHKQLAGFCDDHGIRYLDLVPVLTPRRAEGLMVNKYDNHPNELCHRIVAEAICDQLLDDLPKADETSED